MVSLLRLVLLVDHVELQATGPVVFHGMVCTSAARTGRRCSRCGATQRRRRVSLLKLA